MYFIPIVYLIIDHFLECKEHFVMENVRQVFLEESHPKNPVSLHRCSLKLLENRVDKFENELSFIEHDGESDDFLTYDNDFEYFLLNYQ
uniref:Uncharacterized protein n=1 Tax=Meloidogyne hapla TaxID=6305 RepID=A0A1I8BUA0_MELHA